MTLPLNYFIIFKWLLQVTETLCHLSPRKTSSDRSLRITRSIKSQLELQITKSTSMANWSWRTTWAKSPRSGVRSSSSLPAKWWRTASALTLSWLDSYSKATTQLDFCHPLTTWRQASSSSDTEQRLLMAWEKIVLTDTKKYTIKSWR